MMAREPQGHAQRASVRGALPALSVLGLLFAGALGGALHSTFSTRGAASGWSTALADPRLPRAIAFTFAVTVATTVLSSLIALALAAAIRRRPRREFLVGVPVLVPHLVLASVAVLWLSAGGLADRLLGGLPVDLVRDSWGAGIVLVSTWKEAPFLTLLVLLAWDDAVIARCEAAATLGADRLAQRRHLVWPAVRTPLALGALVAAAFVLGSFEVPLLVGPTEPAMLAVLALQQTRVGSLDGTAVASATLLLTSLLALVPALFVARFARRADA
ncbi:MAG: putative spermidine/putrescine transport system permease protein [Glaciecola sp.]|jgi:putative spermidine/putrescine transport system permease protein